MSHGPFDRFLTRMPKRKRKGLGANAIGGEEAYDSQGVATNPNPSANDTGEGYNAVQGANLAPDVDPREGSTPLDAMAGMNTHTRKSVLSPDSFQVIKYQKLYYPDEDCTQLEAIGIGQAIPSNPTIYPVFTMPSLMRGIIRYVGFDSNEFADRFFTILINGTPVPGYGNFQGQIGTIPRPFDTFIIVPQASQLQISVATVSTGGGNTFSFRFKGWYWPIASEQPETIVEHYGLVNPEEEGLI